MGGNLWYEVSSLFLAAGMSLFDMTFSQADYTVGVLIRYASMSNNDHRTAIAMELRQVTDNLGGVFRVEVPCRLIRQNNFGPIEQSPRYSCSLPLPRAEFRRSVVLSF